MLTDTHCHLNFDRFDDDRDAVLARALDAGVSRILNPGVDLITSRQAVELADRHDIVFAAVGLHPNSAGEWTADFEGEVRRLCASGQVVAIGEIGLDYYWNTFPHDLQQQVFRAQLDLAASLGLPVVIHNREATEDVLSILIDWQAGLAAKGNPLASRPGVLHSFSGNRQDAERAMAAGFFIGITGPVTFKNAPELQQLVADLPLERLVIETDAPFLTPHPYRGKRNEPAHVHLVAEKIAELKGMAVEEVIEATWENSIVLFRW